MYLKKIIIENFKGFSGRQEIEFNFPNGEENGLNFFIGENNTGKSTVFEAVNFLFSGLPKSVDINDLKNKDRQTDELFIELEIIGDLSNSLGTKYASYIQSFGETEIIKLGRNSKVYSVDQGGRKPVDMSVKKLGIWHPEKEQYENPTGFDTAFKQFFDIDFIWADTSPEDITKFGSTTIVGKLISRISDGFKDSEQYKDFETKYNKVFNDEETGLKSKLKEIGGIAEGIFKEQFGEAKINFHFDSLDVSSYFKNTKIEIDDGTKTFLDEKGSGMQRAVALTLLQVYINMLPESEEDRKPFYFFIDEPEICLHPKAQIKLIKALNKLSKTQQIFLTTHSPYIFKETGGKLTKVNIFNKESEIINIQNTADDFGLFGRYSPSWGEINYYAYNLPTVEFHNELYGYIQEQAILEDEKYYFEKDFDDYILSKLSKTDLDRIEWVRVKRDGTEQSTQRTNQVYIRNKIHHPENTKNRDYTDVELKQSIDEMIYLCKNL